MKSWKGKLYVLISLVLIAGGILSLPDAAAAQTKKKTAKKTAKPTSAPQPVPTRTMPVIISQADQYQNQNQQIVTGNEQPQISTPVQTQPETFDEKLDKINSRLKELNARMKNIESTKQNEYDERQKRLLLNLDILTRAEQRAETLRRQMFDLVEKENSIKTKLQNLEMDARPEMIDRQISTVGSLRPEELRDLRSKSLDSEKKNLQNLLSEIQATRESLELNVSKADQLVDKLRAVLEKDIDDALSPKTDQ
ncbi:MAG: hypothetical protein JSS81_21275 [Acidobacteria bacterium]|nr:hypothetical protein [Acidobacteriota bacterium]